MKILKNKIFFIVFMILFCFFVSLKDVEAGRVLIYDRSGKLEKETYELAKKNYDNNNLDISFGNSSGEYFDMCFYKIHSENKGLLRDGFSYLIIGYNPTKGKNGEFAFAWSSYVDTAGLYLPGPFGIAPLIFEKLYGQYFYYGGRQSYISYDDLKSAGGYDKNSKHDGKTNMPYIYFYDNASINKLKKGVCPSYADDTSGWVDDNETKKICFSDTKNGCAKMGNAWNDGVNGFGVVKFNDKCSGKHTVECMSSSIKTAATKISKIDVKINKSKKINMCKNPASFTNAVNKILVDMNNNMIDIATGDRSSDYIGGIKVVNYDGKTAKMTIGSPVLNYNGGKSSGPSYKLVTAYNKKYASFIGYCEKQGYKKSTIEKAISAQMKNAFSKLGGGNKVTFVPIEGCESIQGTKFYKYLQYFFNGIKLATPVLIVVLSMKDFVGAVASSEEKDMKKAQKNVVIRLVVGICIFLLPTLVNVIVSFVDNISGNACGIK